MTNDDDDEMYAFNMWHVAFTRHALIHLRRLSIRFLFSSFPNENDNLIIYPCGSAAAPSRRRSETLWWHSHSSSTHTPFNEFDLLWRVHRIADTREFIVLDFILIFVRLCELRIPLLWIGRFLSSPRSIIIYVLDWISSALHTGIITIFVPFTDHILSRAKNHLVRFDAN